MTKELELTLTLRNNRLKSRRKQLGFTQRQMAIAAGINLTTYNAFENMKKNPLRKSGEWTTPAVKLAEYFDMSLHELFPGVVLAAEQSSAVRYLDEHEAAELMSSDSIVRSLPIDAIVEGKDRIQRALACRQRAVAQFGTRDRAILEMHDDGIPMREIGERYNISVTRVSDIIFRAKWRIRKFAEMASLAEQAEEDGHAP